MKKFIILYKAPVDAEIVGYSVLEAKDMDDAISLLKGHPHISGWSAAASIEVHESMQLPGM